MRIYGMLEDLMGCGYHRVKAPLDELRRQGHTVTVSHQPPRDLRDWDVLQIQKFTMPELMPMLWEIKKLGRPKIVHDLDDDLFNVPPDNPASRFYNDPTIRQNLKRSIQLADGLTVTNPYLLSVCRTYSDAPAIVIPNYVNDWNLHRPKWSKFQMGWTGGFSHENDLKTIVESVNRFLETRPKQHVHIVGQDYSRFFLRSRFSSWLPYDDYLKLLSKRISVGLAVVDDDPFNLGKSDIKLIEYAASGAVPVYSNLPPYVGTRVDGINVGDPFGRFPEWWAALEWLYEDEERLNQKIHAAWDSVRGMTHQNHWPERLAFYEEVTGL